MGHASVERAAAIALPDPRLGERVCLAVMFRTGRAVPLSEVLDHMSAAGLSRYDMPEYTLELAEIPLMSNGKIHKRDIVKWIGNGEVNPVAVQRT